MYSRKDTLRAVERMMKNMGIPLENAMDALEIKGEDRDEIAKAVKG